MSGYAIRPFRTLEDYQECVDLQERVWGRGFSERVSVAILKVSQRLGGVAAGAYDDEGTLAGFVFGMTGVEGEEVIHWSDMLAVRPGLRDAGLGTRLKAYQRRVLLERGIRKVYWTFDPLESRNAYLNFAKLGIVVREYVENMYGHTDSPLHRGIGTDRFVALWLLDTRRVRERVEEGRAPPSPERTAGEVALDADPVDDTVGPGPPRLELDARRITVAVPSRIQELKERSPETAVAWREATRRVFVHYLARGWEVRELIRSGDDGVSRYLLVREEGGMSEEARR